MGNDSTMKSFRKDPLTWSNAYVGANVLSLLTDDALIATWNNEGLPADGMSTENATILTNSVKWPLIIDPQLQVLFTLL